MRQCLRQHGTLEQDNNSHQIICDKVNVDYLFYNMLWWRHFPSWFSFTYLATRWRECRFWSHSSICLLLSLVSKICIYCHRLAFQYLQGWLRTVSLQIVKLNPCMSHWSPITILDLLFDLSITYPTVFWYWHLTLLCKQDLPHRVRYNCFFFTSHLNSAALSLEGAPQADRRAGKPRYRVYQSQREKSAQTCNLVCHNGGQCFSDVVENVPPRCLCKIGYGGRMCEQCKFLELL